MTKQQQTDNSASSGKEAVNTDNTVAANDANTNPAAANTANTNPEEVPVSILKPDAFNLDKFKSKRAALLDNVATLLTALPVIRPADAKDYFRIHPNEETYWSHELCFVSVPIKGQKGDTLHLIDEELGMCYLPAARIKRFRLALATKPYDGSHFADIEFFTYPPWPHCENLFSAIGRMPWINRPAVDAYVTAIATLLLFLLHAPVAGSTQ